MEYGMHPLFKFYNAQKKKKKKKKKKKVEPRKLQIQFDQTDTTS